jgi:aladin
VPAPPPGSVTLGEVNGALLALSDPRQARDDGESATDRANLELFRRQQGLLLPPVLVPPVAARSRSAALPSSEALLRLRAPQSCWERAYDALVRLATGTWARLNDARLLFGAPRPRAQAFEGGEEGGVDVDADVVGADEERVLAGALEGAEEEDEGEEETEEDAGQEEEEEEEEDEDEEKKRAARKRRAAAAAAASDGEEDKERGDAEEQDFRLFKQSPGKMPRLRSTPVRRAPHPLHPRPGGGFDESASPGRSRSRILRELASDGPVRAFDWHPFRQRWAVALADDSVMFYDVGAGRWEKAALRHEFQRQVRMLRWSPVGGAALAVACERGVALWRLVSSPTQTAWMTWLRFEGHEHVLSVDFSPCGRYLVSCAARGAYVVVWEVAKGALSATPLQLQGGARFVRWSPSGEYLFAASQSAAFRVWRTSDWSASDWQLSDACRFACWDPSGELLLVSKRGSAIVNMFNFRSTAQTLQGKVVVDCSADDELPEERRGGGAVDLVAWSPTSERLAVSFGVGSSLVAVFTCDPRELVMSFSPLGFIRGPPHPLDSRQPNGPVAMCFHPHFDAGAMLAVCWAGGLVSTVPMYFSQAASRSARR